MKFTRAALMASLPEELLDIVAANLKEELWPPIDSAITDWNSYPSSAAQHDLCSLSLVCRTLYRIVIPHLWESIVRDFDGKTCNELAFTSDKYQWLSPDNSSWELAPQGIRVLYLHDSFHDSDPSLQTQGMMQLLHRLSPSLEALVTQGFCASILLHTLNTSQMGEMASLKVLKLRSHTITVASIFAAFHAFPNLTTLTIDANNIECGNNLSRQTFMPKSTSISQLDICMRLYATEEYEALRQILLPLMPTLKMLRIHGEYHEESHQIISLLKISSIETLLLNFRHRFPDGLTSIRIPTLRTLSVSTYANISSEFWECDLFESVSNLIVTTSDYSFDPALLAKRINAPNLKVLQLQSLCSDRNEQEEQNWNSRMKEWCSASGISFRNRCSNNGILVPQDDYLYLETFERLSKNDWIAG